MRRFVTLAVLLLFAVPFGVSISGCSKAVPVTYCNGQTSGVVVGQTTTLTLGPSTTGISLNQGEIGQVPSPSATDCKGNSASAANVVYGSSNLSLVDIVPASGRICAGTWNRNSGGGIADYTVCTPGPQNGISYITASAQAVVSNPIPVYVHPVITSVLLGPPSINCITDPASNCFDTTGFSGATPSYTCLPAPIAATPCVPGAYVVGCGYVGTGCLSQGQSALLVARAYQGTNVANPANNISCQVGPISFTQANGAVVTIATGGLATAAQPGSTTINANTSQSSSSAGFFATCPPASIVLSAAGQTGPPTAPLNVPTSTAQSIVATVTDTAGNPVTSIPLQYVSTAPVVVPASGSVITPQFPGSAAVTAICQPPNCNSAPFNEIGLFGTGTLVTSNPVQINSTGAGITTVLYIASTGSQYLQPVDFTLPTQGAPVRLPYVPTSLAISQDDSTIYMGTPNEIMIFSTLNNTLTKQDTTISGNVLAVSPDNSTVVVTDPVRKLIYLYLGSSGGVTSEYGGVATRAQWSPDSQTVYIITNDNRLLVYSTFTGWTAVPLSGLATDVTITIPQVGVYLAGGSAATATAPATSTTPGSVTARTSCPVTSTSNTGLATTTTNTFYPQIAVAAASDDRLAATNDGVHILGANTAAFTDITTNQKSGVCPVAFTNTPGAPLPLGVAATTIANVLPTSDSAYAFVTYQGTGGAVPEYIQSTTPGTPGTLTRVPLQHVATAAAPIAAVSGVVSTDNQTFYTGTSGDNLVHRLTRTPTGFTDTLTPIVPALPGINGGIATPDLIAQRPKKSTS